MKWIEELKETPRVAKGRFTLGLGSMKFTHNDVTIKESDFDRLITIVERAESLMMVYDGVSCETTGCGLCDTMYTFKQHSTKPYLVHIPKHTLDCPYHEDWKP